MEKDKIKITMSLDVLENMVYQATLKASRIVKNEFYKGIISDLDRFKDDHHTIISEIDYIKLLLQNQNLKDEQEDET